MNIFIKKSVASEITKSLKSTKDKLEQLKNEVIAILKKKENQDIKKAIEYLESTENHYTHLEKSLDGKWIEKAGYGVGTVRIWKGKKYKKVSASPTRWVRVFDKNDRGAATSMGRYIAQVKKCQSVEELYNFCMKQRSLFQDENGVDLPIMDKLRAAIDEQSEKLEGSGNIKDDSKADKRKDLHDVTIDDYSFQKVGGKWLVRDENDGLIGGAKFNSKNEAVEWAKRNILKREFNDDRYKSKTERGEVNTVNGKYKTGDIVTVDVPFMEGDYKVMETYHIPGGNMVKLENLKTKEIKRVSETFVIGKNKETNSENNEPEKFWNGKVESEVGEGDFVAEMKGVGGGLYRNRFKTKAEAEKSTKNHQALGFESHVVEDKKDVSKMSKDEIKSEMVKQVKLKNNRDENYYENLRKEFNKINEIEYQAKIDAGNKINVNDFTLNKLGKKIDGEYPKFNKEQQKKLFSRIIEEFGESEKARKLIQNMQDFNSQKGEDLDINSYGDSWDYMKKQVGVGEPEQEDTHYWIQDSKGNRLTNEDAKKKIKSNFEKMLEIASNENEPRAEIRNKELNDENDFLVERLNPDDQKEMENERSNFIKTLIEKIDEKNKKESNLNLSKEEIKNIKDINKLKELRNKVISENQRLAKEKKYKESNEMANRVVFIERQIKDLESEQEKYQNRSDAMKEKDVTDMTDDELENSEEKLNQELLKMKRTDEGYEEKYLKWQKIHRENLDRKHAKFVAEEKAEQEKENAEKEQRKAERKAKVEEKEKNGTMIRSAADVTGNDKVDVTHSGSTLKITDKNGNLLKMLRNVTNAGKLQANKKFDVYQKVKKELPELSTPSGLNKILIVGNDYYVLDNKKLYTFDDYKNRDVKKSIFDFFDVELEDEETDFEDNDATQPELFNSIDCDCR